MQDSEGEQEDSSDTECKYVCLVFFENMSGFCQQTDHVYDVIILGLLR